MEKLTDVLNMGGYAAYVWPSYLLAAAVMCGMAAIGLRALYRARKAAQTAAGHADEA